MKIFQQAKVVPLPAVDADFTQYLEEHLVLEAYRAGYYLPEKPEMTQRPSEFGDGMVDVRWRGYGVKMAEAEN